MSTPEEDNVPLYLEATTLQIQGQDQSFNAHVAAPIGTATGIIHGILLQNSQEYVTARTEMSDPVLASMNQVMFNLNPCFIRGIQLETGLHPSLRVPGFQWFQHFQRTFRQFQGDLNNYYQRSFWQFP